MTMGRAKRKDSARKAWSYEVTIACARAALPHSNSASPAFRRRMEINDEHELRSPPVPPSRPSRPGKVRRSSPARVFLEKKQANRSFGNVWGLNGFLIFKDTSGVLEEEQLVRCSISSSTQDNSSANVDPVTAVSDRLATVSDRSLTALTGSTFADAGGTTNNQSLEALDLPPLAPTSERPEYCARYTSTDTLGDDILLSICNYYRLDDENNRNIRLGWCKLTHVCRGWRRLVHDSASYLGMHILCTNGTPTVATLDHLSFLPLVVDYQDVSATIDTQDKLTEDRNLILPTTFLALNPRHLTLVLGVDLPKELLLLTSTVSLIILTLTNTRVSALPQLEELSIGFSILLPRPSAERELLVTLETLVTVHTLKRLTFQGTSAHLESLIARHTAPLLEQLSITLFNQVAFTLPHLSIFTNAIGRLRLPDAKVAFNRKAVSVVTVHLLPQPDDRTSSLGLRVICKQFDWQMDAVAQTCSALVPVLSKRLALDFDEHAMPAEWQDGAVDGTTWHELLRPFVGTRKLRMCRALTLELFFALELDGVGLMLPGLLVLAPELEQEQADNAFSPFVVTRQVVRRPVYLLPWLVQRPHPSSEDPLQCPVCSVISGRRQERD
ncbi:hypothetical protein EDB86DRAFT_2829149 [Lactarius hatsudake]|nr:hypothetical protein EDB86DRAFT_2829149 [Lactarius hatsudake]